MKTNFLLAAMLLLTATGAKAQTVLVGDTQLMSPADFGITTNLRSWDGNATIKPAGKARKIKEDYQMLLGKRHHCTNRGTEQRYTLTNAQGDELTLVMRRYRDGYAFRYELAAKPGEVFTGDNTRYHCPASAPRWTSRYTGAGYENFFPLCPGGVSPERVDDTNWAYPALFELTTGTYALITDSYSPAFNCGTTLSNKDDRNVYSVQLIGDEPMATADWHSAWHVVITGTLADVVESTLVTDVAEPCKLTDTSWIQPGVSSWIYWAYNHGSQEYSILKEYVDLAVDMHWPYTLVDAEWDQMRGGSIEQLVKYACDRGIKPMIWYNSTTGWYGNGSPTPQHLLNEADSREREFAKIAGWGVTGVKIDFFADDNCKITNYYRELLECAAKHHLTVNFHGATIPHGWQRTYPNMVSCEAVYGAEWYNNNGRLTNRAARHNATLPFTRNVIGSMDYTPCTFTDSQHPHITTHAHELALTVLFESGVQHMADRPSAYTSQPIEVREMLSSLPAAWDETLLLAGYPGEEVVMARRKGGHWYVAGINGTDGEKTLRFSLKRLGKTAKEATLFGDSGEQLKFAITRPNVQQEMQVKCDARGGFVMVL